MPTEEQLKEMARIIEEDPGRVSTIKVSHNFSYQGTKITQTTVFDAGTELDALALVAAIKIMKLKGEKKLPTILDSIHNTVEQIEEE